MNHRSITTALRPFALGLAVAAVALPALGQSQQQPRAAAAAAKAKGLDALDDDRLMSELATLRLNALLDHAFEANKVPAEKREAVLAILAIQDLGNPQKKLTAREKQELVKKLVTGIQNALPTVKDPQLLLKQARGLIDNVIRRDLNTLEYWGENPKTQATLNPVATAVVGMLERSAELAQAQADEIANQIKSPEDPNVARYMEAHKLVAIAHFTRNEARYPLVLSLDKADPKRKEIAAEAIEYLKQWDTPTSTVQPVVRLRLGKFLLARGDYEEAKKTLNSLSDPAAGIQPEPALAQQYEGRYFAAVADLLARNADAAMKSLEGLEAWQKANLKDPSALEGAEAASAMLRYRIHDLRAQTADSADAKRKANDEAVATLLKLVEKRPDLRGVIYDQLSDRITDDMEIASLDPLLLQAIIRKGEVERLKEENETVDAKAIERAVAAAQELVRRKGKPGVTADLVDRAAIITPFLLDRLEGREADAATAFLDYAENFKANQQNARLALDYATAIIAELRRSRPDDAATIRLYERFLPIAIGQPYDRKEFSFEYARLLQQEGKFRDAAKYYASVPADDPRALNARFLQMVALNQTLDAERSTLSADDRKKLQAQIQALATQVNDAAQQALGAATTPGEQARHRSMIVKTSLLAAKLANRDDGNPRRALELLAGFEDRVKGLPGESDLLGEALFIRVDSFMDLGQNTEATAALVNLLDTREGGQGAQIIYGLLQKLDADLDTARQQNDQDQMRLLARARAELSGHLVNWAANNPDPNIRKFTYRYRTFDAATKHLAAQLEPDPAARQRALQEALAKYQELRKPEAVALYQQTVPEGTDPSYPDPVVTLGIASIQFDLGNYKDAQPLFGQLLADRKLGSAKMVADDQLVDNDQYWEATYKLLKANAELAKSDESLAATLDNTRNHLKRLYIQWGSQTGGKKWHDRFEQLRKELIPDFNYELTATPAA